MRRALLAFGAFLCFVGSASANCVGPVVSGKCLSGTQVQGYGDQPSANYQGNSGTSYQYNLSNPVDRNAYRVDLDAQRRDQLNTSPGRVQDRSSGQYGGGVQDPNVGCTTWPCR